MKSKAYLDFIHSKPCIIEGTFTQVDAHHVKSILKTGKKPPDFLCVPLNHDVHLYELHQMNEAKFWEKYGINILAEIIRLNVEFLTINTSEPEFINVDILQQLIAVNEAVGASMEQFAELKGIEL